MNLEAKDAFLMEICDVLAAQSKCRSRQIGALAVRGDRIISTGYNGPPRGFEHCGLKCPRREQGYPSGEGLHLCPAVHAEANVISNAASLGHSLEGAILYLNTVVPCKACMGQLINAGIKGIVVLKMESYDRLGPEMAEQCGIYIREAKV